MNIVTIRAPYVERQLSAQTCARCHQKTMSARMFETTGGLLLGVSVSCGCGHKQTFDRYGNISNIVHTSKPEKIIVDDTPHVPLG